MKVTSLKDVDSYIYSSVVLPLKELDVDGLAISSPMTTRRGQPIKLQVTREETGHRRYDHNYQRDEARNSALHLIWYKFGYNQGVLADYDSRKHNVRVYAPAFRDVDDGKFLMNKLLQAFGNYTPFTNVSIEESVRDGYQGGEISSNLERDDDYEEDYDD